MQNSVILCIIGIGLGFALSFIFNKLPARWLCDYDETPSDDLFKKRVKFFPVGLISAITLGIGGFVFGYKYNEKYHDIYINIILLMVLFSLIIIFVSDLKYTIIPDQFIVIICICAIFLFVLFCFFKITIFYDYFLSPLLGGIIGGGSMLLMSIMGKLFYKKDVMGFGDVKLFFACGILLGANGAIFCFICSLVVASIFFMINMMFKRLSLVSMVPFGPFICISTTLFMLFSHEIKFFTQWYLSLL